MKTIRFAADYQDRHASNMLLFAADPSVKEVNAGGSGELDLSGLDDVVISPDPVPDLEADRREAMAILDELNLHDLDLGHLDAPEMATPPARARGLPRPNRRKRWKDTRWSYRITRIAEALEASGDPVWRFEGRTTSKVSRAMIADLNRKKHLRMRLQHHLMKEGVGRPEFCARLRPNRDRTGRYIVDVMIALPKDDRVLEATASALRLACGEMAETSRKGQAPHWFASPAQWALFAENVDKAPSAPMLTEGLRASAEALHEASF